MNELVENEWQPIATAPKDGTDIIVGFDRAGIWITHTAWWHDLEGYAAGWWSYTVGSVTQELLDEDRSPTHWIPQPKRPT